MPHSPSLTIACGLPGSGKTTLAKRLASEGRVVRLAPDEWLAALGASIWDGEMRGRVEELQRALLADLLRAGASVVVEWGSWTRSERDSLRDLAHSLGARAELHVLHADVPTLFRRVSARGQENPPITIEQLWEWQAAFEMVDAAEAATYEHCERVPAGEA